MKWEVGGRKSEVGRKINWQVVAYFSLLALVSVACSKEKEELDITGDYEYYPLEIGKYWVYEVDSLLFSKAINGNKIDSIRTFLKDTIVEQFIANTGDTIFRVERFERRTNAESWQFSTVFSMSRNKEQAFRTENNIPLIKLVFPLRRPDGWNSAALVDNGVDFSIAGQNVKIFDFWSSRTKIDSVGNPLIFNNLQFQETAKVTYVERTDITTSLRVAVERYAKGVGLIQREWRILDSQCTTCGTEWRAKAEKGFILQQRLLEHN